MNHIYKIAQPVSHGVIQTSQTPSSSSNDRVSHTLYTMAKIDTKWETLISERKVLRDRLVIALTVEDVEGFDIVLDFLVNLLVLGGAGRNMRCFKKTGNELGAELTGTTKNIYMFWLRSLNLLVL